jgi:hypothetical protein
LKKLESENESKTACISLLEEDQKEKETQLAKMKQDACDVAAKHRQQCLQLEASLELKVGNNILIADGCNCATEETILQCSTVTGSSSSQRRGTGDHSSHFDVEQHEGGRGEAGCEAQRAIGQKQQVGAGACINCASCR